MRKHLKDRILALWLAVCMVLTMMPSMAMPVFAAIDTGNDGTTDATIVDSITVGGQKIETFTGKGTKEDPYTAAISLKAFSSVGLEVKTTEQGEEYKAEVKYELVDEEIGEKFEGTTTGDQNTKTAESVGNLDGKKKLAIMVDPDKSETEKPIIYFLISVYATGDVTPGITGTLTRGVKISETTIDLTADGELKFVSPVDNSYFILEGEGANGVKVAQCNTDAGKTKVTLTLDGTPTATGDITIKVSRDAFESQLAPDVDSITVKDTQKITVNAGETATPVFASASVMCENGDMRAEIPLKDVTYAGDHGDVKVNVYGGDERPKDNPTASYEKDSGSIILKFEPEKLQQDTDYKISVKDGDRTESDKADIKVLTYKEITADPDITEVVAEQGNQSAVVEVGNPTAYKTTVIAKAYTKEDGTGDAGDVSEATYGKGKLTLNFSPEIEGQKTYYIVFEETGKAPSAPVKLIVKPVTTTPSASSGPVTAKADKDGNANTEAELTITPEGSEYAETGTVDVAVYKDAEKSALAAGVTGKYVVGGESGKKLTLSFKPALTADNTYYVAFTYTKAPGNVYEESGTLPVTVQYVPTTAPMIVGGETESIEIDTKDDTNKNAEFIVDNAVAYKNVTVAVYNEDGVSLATKDENNKQTQVTGKYENGKVTLTMDPDITGQQVYLVSLTETNPVKLESKKLRVIVNSYVKASDAEMTAVTGTVGSETLTAERDEADGKSPETAIPWHFNVLQNEVVTGVTLTISPKATVKYKSSNEVITEAKDIDKTDTTDDNVNKKTVKISSLDFSSNKYLYVEVTSEDGKNKTYHVITLNEAILEAGEPADTKADLGNYTDELKGANITGTGVETSSTSSDKVLGRTAALDAAGDKGLVDLMNSEGVYGNPAEGTVWKRLKDAHPDIPNQTIHYYYETYLAVDVESYNADAKTMELDITPMYNVVASTNAVSSSYDLSTDAVLLRQGIAFEVDEPVTVELVIPADIVATPNKVYVKHDTEPWNGYQVEVGQKVKVPVSGFSPFYVRADVPGAAQISDKPYDTVQEAVDAVTKNGTVSLTDKTTAEELQALTPPTGITPESDYDNTGVKFKMEKGSSGIYPNKENVKFVDTIVDGYRYHAEILDNGDVTVTRKQVFDITIGNIIGSGSITADPNPAASGDVVTLDVSGELMDVKAFNVYENEEIKNIDLTEKTFTMPASPVIITATFTEGTVEPAPGPDTPTVGDLTVSKTVTGDEGDKTKEFNFTVTLSSTGITGTYGGMTFTNGVATFKLKDGQSIKASNLPKDITYTVAEAEANQDGYTTTSTGASGTITAGANVTAAFTNTKGSGGDQPTPPPVEENTLRFVSSTQEEALKDRATNDKDCALKLEAVDGADIGDLSSWKVESDNEAVVQVLDNNELRYMDLGTANITVTATGKDGKTYTITFPVNVTKLGTPTFTLSHVSSKKARTFTVTTSTVRGATGFQVQYSLRKSLKSSKQPSYAVGKKLNRKTIKANKSKRTYYVRVRAYKIVDGERINGAWSKLTKKIKSR